jgi:hypothetical protein
VILFAEEIIIESILDNGGLGFLMIFFVCEGNTGRGTQGFMLARQALHYLNHAHSPFFLVILKIGSCSLPRLA